jgi:hypothetical protein
MSSNLINILQGLNGKASADAISSAIIQSVEDGAANPLEVKIKAKIMQEALASAVKEIDFYAQAEAEKYGRAGDTLHGAKFSIAEVGSRYDYQSCKDLYYQELLEKQADLDELFKEREKFLKAITKPTAVIHPDTGESYEINPPVKYSTTQVKIKLL